MYYADPYVSYDYYYPDSYVGYGAGYAAQPVAPAASSVVVEAPETYGSVTIIRTHRYQGDGQWHRFGEQR